MSLQQILFGLLEFLVSVAISFMLVFATYRFILWLTKHFDEENQLRQKNTSVGIVLGSIILGQAIIVRQAIYPVMAVIQIFITGEAEGGAVYLKTLGFGIGYVFLSGFLAILCIVFGLWLFDKLTPGIKQYEEIKNNNLAVAVFLAFVITAICFLISAGVAGLTRALIPFPKIGSVPLT
jgi:uncharacterized membrane protein YjfL (UPF0719 family)